MKRYPVLALAALMSLGSLSFADQAGTERGEKPALRDGSGLGRQQDVETPERPGIDSGTDTTQGAGTTDTLLGTEGEAGRSASQPEAITPTGSDTIEE
ncbi:hypothetical protein DN824_20040 [Stutzerimonas nosocomialis]|uniref:Phage infection protein n=1 Tax=Stutzerimonas nosocomialis TaxID=1056496 RepID=A0A5R9QJZ1_9GAMM|nr:hypothetical protein [Stutzerimonas nosocomialis]TLX55189.1 hypothetical protein DN824_20040 [Stutzerimonas nosocomialis]TLX58110.1 hypothetical protein DN826_05215 [Stutzerimonas nosocomialis]TLX65273.1 hypothetical protein DN820_02900 [Stutzerimonas nosocomialis]